MKKALTLFLFLFLAKASFSQQDAMLSQYMFNGLYINPAYAGTHRVWEATFQHRNQWVNFDGAPKTSFLSVEGPVNFNRMGVGLVVADEKIGVTRQTDVGAIYSYHVQTGEGKLSFGVKAGVSNYSARTMDLTVWDKTEDLYAANINHPLIPKFGFGAYYYKPKFYAGFSIPTLLAYDNEKSFSVDLSKSSFYRRHYLLTSGIVLKVNETMMLRPSVLIKYAFPSAPQVDINMSILFKETLWLSASYRSGDAIVALVEYQINPYLKAGYSYDFTTSMISTYSSGSHEIMIGYSFYNKDNVKIKTPRFF